ncbi:MAG: type II secretion system F family protein [Desulfobacterales bacterium]|nr:type II secretion system F family protein [Desulfobacterales bacterium]MDD4072493.1 type II secretion system F family protein [Desulfobacterales bacterium]MDD4391129.1 type II secretion system F family protein [Desulfobacterales bacterium]
MKFAVIGVIIFILSVLIIELAVYALKQMHSANRSKVRKRLRKYSYIQTGSEHDDIIRRRILSEIPGLNRLLWNIPGMPHMDLLIQQANAKSSLGYFILLTLLLPLSSFLIGTMLSYSAIISALIAMASGSLPFLALLYMKKKRIEKFRKQLPEGLELIARALKAGHALSSGIKLVADEFSDPMGPEFDETIDEINFGVSTPNALKNLGRRINCPELHYFIVAVILQRETGGNLAEIIESIAWLIRERFKLRGKINVLASEGKLSAMVLTGLPFVVALFLQISNPDYLNVLFTDPVGKIMLIAAGTMMLIGIFIMKRMIEIKV